jgi:hypothetical protein
VILGLTGKGVRLVVNDTPIPHGTANGYKHYGCRCDGCKAAYSEYSRERRKQAPKSPVSHGTFTGYIYFKCRCDECKAAYSEYMRRRYEADPEKHVARNKRYRQANPEKMAEYARRRAQDPEFRSIRCDTEHRRRARKRDAFVEDVSHLEIFERDNWQCQIPGCLYPGIPATLDVKRRYDPMLASLDHVIPLSKGGKHERSNLACSHLRCNTVKRDRIEGIA